MPQNASVLAIAANPTQLAVSEVERLLQAPATKFHVSLLPLALPLAIEGLAQWEAIDCIRLTRCSDENVIGRDKQACYDSCLRVLVRLPLPSI